jgi:hypothetical protein
MPYYATYPTTYVLSEITEIEAMARDMGVAARHYLNFKGENHYGYK